MRHLTKIALILLQWALIAFGLFLILIASNTYQMESQYFAAQPTASATDTATYYPPTFQRLMVGTTTGLIAMGLGAVLFYLRRLYAARIR